MRLYAYQVMVNFVGGLGSQVSKISDRSCSHPADEAVFWILKHSLCTIMDTKVGSIEDGNSLHDTLKPGHRT